MQVRNDLRKCCTWLAAKVDAKFDFPGVGICFGGSGCIFAGTVSTVDPNQPVSDGQIVLLTLSSTALASSMCALALKITGYCLRRRLLSYTSSDVTEDPPPPRAQNAFQGSPSHKHNATTELSSDTSKSFDDAQVPQVRIPPLNIDSELKDLPC